jgi:hypothetical protein
VWWAEEKIESEIFMQTRPPSSSEIRRFGRRMGEKVEEIFPGKFPPKIGGPVCRAAAHSRRADGLWERAAGFELLSFLTLCVSHARRALVVMTKERRLDDFVPLAALITLYSLGGRCSKGETGAASGILPCNGCPACECGTIFLRLASWRPESANLARARYRHFLI